MNLSYWEYTSWLSNIDYTIIGSGIVGLSTALNLATRFPKAKVLVLEKGVLPQGASTKNAGFACFGSISEVLSDLKSHSEVEVKELIKMRYEGIIGLRHLLGDEAIDYQANGGHELFLDSQQKLYENCLEQLEYINEMLVPIFKKDVFRTTANPFKFSKIQPNYITHSEEGQLDTGKMMNALLRKTLQSGVQILNAITVRSFEESGSGVNIITDQFDFTTKKLLIATNGFASQLLSEDVKPARAQVVLTKPIPNLKIKGTFHLEEGYYYFRNIDNRILLGGGRNLDFKTEETTQFGKTEVVQKKLAQLLSEVILPDTNVAIDMRWSGIMGVGKQKRPVVKQHSNHVYCGVRLGGMGIAIGTKIGTELARLID